MNEATVDRQIASTESATARAWTGWFACFVVALALYAATANRGPQWQDSGDHILRVVTGESGNPLGLALIHPLHHWLCRFAVTLISSLAAAFAVANIYGCVVTLTSDRLVAAFAAISLAIANTFWKLATVTEVNTLTAALLSAECWCLIAFITSRPIDNRQSTIDNLPSWLRGGACPGRAGVPSWLAPGASPSQGEGRGEGTCTSAIAFLGMFLFNGLGLANHNLALLTTPLLAVVALIALRNRWVSARRLFLAAAVWSIGSLPYTGLVLSEAMRSGDLPATVQSALFGNIYKKDVLNAPISGLRMLMNVAFIALNFPNLLLPAALFGFFAARRIGVAPLARRALLAALLIHAAFALRYSVADQHYFFLPMYVLLVIFGGIGFAAFRRAGAPLLLQSQISNLRSETSNLKSETSNLKSEISNPKSQREVGFSLPSPRRDRIMIASAILLALTPLLYAFTPALARRFDVLSFIERHKPYRDDYVYLFTPWSVVERSAERMSREAVDLAADNGVIIVEDRMAEFAVRYRVIRNGKTGIMITREMEPKDFVRAVEEGRPIVLVPRSVDKPITLPLAGSWRRIGDLYILNP